MWPPHQRFIHNAITSKPFDQFDSLSTLNELRLRNQQSFCVWEIKTQPHWSATDFAQSYSLIVLFNKIFTFFRMAFSEIAHWVNLTEIIFHTFPNFICSFYLLQEHF